MTSDAVALIIRGGGIAAIFGLAVCGFLSSLIVVVLNLNHSGRPQTRQVSSWWRRTEAMAAFLGFVWSNVHADFGDPRLSSLIVLYRGFALVFGLGLVAWLIGAALSSGG